MNYGAQLRLTVTGKQSAAMSGQLGTDPDI